MAVADVKLAGLVAESIEAVASLSDAADSAGKLDAMLIPDYFEGYVAHLFGVCPGEQILSSELGGVGCGPGNCAHVSVEGCELPIIHGTRLSQERVVTSAYLSL